MTALTDDSKIFFRQKTDSNYLSYIKRISFTNSPNDENGYRALRNTPRIFNWPKSPPSLGLNRVCQENLEKLRTILKFHSSKENPRLAGY